MARPVVAWLSGLTLLMLVAVAFSVGAFLNAGRAPVPAVTGAVGADGADGQDGQDGTDGSDGADGSPGIGVPGPRGSTGAAGADGEDGVEGADGAPGTDAQRSAAAFIGYPVQLTLVDDAPLPFAGDFAVSIDPPVTFDGVDTFTVVEAGSYLIAFSVEVESLPSPIAFDVARNGQYLHGGHLWVDAPVSTPTRVLYTDLAEGDEITVATDLLSNSSPVFLSMWTSISFQLIAPA